MGLGGAGAPGGPSDAEIQRVIVDVLAPFIGKNVAEASARGYVKRLAASGATSFGAKEIDLLAGWIAPGLKVFAGDARAAQVTAELRAALQKLVTTSAGTEKP